MSWLDTLRARAQEAKAQPASSPPPLPTRKETPRPYRAPTTDRAAAPRRVRHETKMVWVQTATPGPDDQGAVEPGFYYVADGVVHMCDEIGKPTGAQRALGQNDDPRTIAYRMRRESWVRDGGGSDFDRPLYYRPLGWV